MSASEQQLLIDEIHQLFDDAVAYNLYSGLAYGTSMSHHSRCVNFPLPLISAS